MKSTLLQIFSAVMIFSIAAGSGLARAGGGEGVRMGPEEALKLLKDGNERFVGGRAKHPHADAGRRKETAEKGQHPFATVIACSDSRVPVEMIFDQGIGDIFTVRVAGNVCGTNEAGSIEYGVDHLATPLLVVLGHTKCGAVTAVATGAKLHGNIPKLADNIYPAVMEVRKEHLALAEDALIEAAVEANVRQSIKDLLDRSKVTKERVKAGNLKIVGAIYDIATGRVEWLGEW